MVLYSPSQKKSYEVLVVDVDVLEGIYNEMRNFQLKYTYVEVVDVVDVVELEKERAYTNISILIIEKRSVRCGSCTGCGTSQL